MVSSLFVYVCLLVVLEMVALGGRGFDEAIEDLRYGRPCVFNKGFAICNP